MKYYVLCTDSIKSRVLIESFISSFRKEKGYENWSYYRNFNTITMYDGIDTTKFIFVPLTLGLDRILQTTQGSDNVISENGFRQMYLLDYDYDYEFDKKFNVVMGNTTPDCNNCSHISLTENNQRENNLIMPHVCTKYMTQCWHNSQDINAYMLYPCDKCKNDSYINYVEVEGAKYWK